MKKSLNEQPLIDFGARVGDERRRLRLSQEEAAKMIGIARSALSAIENGSRYLNQFELRSIAKAYRISADSLLDL